MGRVPNRSGSPRTCDAQARGRAAPETALQPRSRNGGKAHIAPIAPPKPARARRFRLPERLKKPIKYVVLSVYWLLQFALLVFIGFSIVVTAIVIPAAMWSALGSAVGLRNAPSGTI